MSRLNTHPASSTSTTRAQTTGSGTTGSGTTGSGTPGSGPRLRVGVLAGLVGIGCCVGPTVLAATGLVAGATAASWGNHLYAGYAWWFRAAGLLLLVALVRRSLRRSGQCSLAGARRVRWRLAGVLAVAVATYALLYALTSWLERFA